MYRTRRRFSLPTQEEEERRLFHALMLRSRHEKGEIG